MSVWCCVGIRVSTPLVIILVLWLSSPHLLFEAQYGLCFKIIDIQYHLNSAIIPITHTANSFFDVLLKLTSFVLLFQTNRHQPFLFVK